MSECSFNTLINTRTSLGGFDRGKPAMPGDKIARKVSYVIESVFPGFTLSSWAKEDFYNKKIRDLTQQKQYLTTPVYFQPEIGHVGAVSGTPLGVVMSIGSVLLPVMTTIRPAIGALGFQI